MSEEVQVLLSQVSRNISEVFVKMSNVNQQHKLKYLAAVGDILHQLRCLVSIKLSSNDASTSIYSLYYDDDETGASMSSDANTSSEDEEDVPDAPTCREERVIDAPTCREKCVIDAQNCHEECVNDSSMSEFVSSITSAPSEVMMNKVLAAINTLAPSSIYDRKKAVKKRRQRMKKLICSELFSIWDNAATILSPVSYSKQSSATTSYPIVDWKSVNKRFLTNIPTPVSLPILGCSPTPDDYEDVLEKSDFGGMRSIGSKFEREFPFGSELGFLTDAGPVNVPKDVFHGYTYQPGQGWLLHAEFPRRTELSMKERMTPKRSRKRQRG